MTFKVAPRETVSKCTVYDNKFRTYPEEARLKVIRAEKARMDAQESEPARYERLLMAKMLKGEFFKQKEQGIAIAALSKLFAMVFLFPPFFMFFQFPKWTFQVAIPKVVESVDGMVTVVMIRLKRISAWTGDVFGTALRKAAKKIRSRIPKVNIPFKSNLKEFKELVHSKIAKIFKPFEVLKGVPPFFKKMADKVLDPIQAKIETLKPYYKALTDGIENWVSKLQYKIDEFTNFLKPLPPPIRAYGQKDPVPAWKEKLIEISEGLKSFAKETVKIILNPVHFFQTKIEPFVNWVYPIFPYLQEQGVNMAQYTTKKITQALERIQEYSRIVAERTAEYINRIAVNAFNQVTAYINYYTKPFVRFAKFFGRKVAQGKNKLGLKIVTFKESFNHGFQQFQNQAKKAAGYLIRKIKKAPALAKAVLDKTSRALFHLYKSLQTLFIFFKVTFKVAFLFLLERANKLLRV